jgi:hypothetical protein
MCCEISPDTDLDVQSESTRARKGSVLPTGTEFVNQRRLISAHLFTDALPSPCPCDHGNDETQELLENPHPHISSAKLQIVMSTVQDSVPITE